MIIERAYALFRRDLLAATAETRARWGDRAPEVLVGFCARKFPVSRSGQILLSLDERLAEVGRRRYEVRR